MELTYRQQIDFQMLVQEVQTLKQMVTTLTTVVKRDKIFDAWLNEEDAASMLGLAPRTLRRYCRDGALPINFRNTNGRNWQFSRKDILTYMNNSSTIM
ncbi:MAG: helix-turn-helix domain-containing protein [Bacteroidetes bacterium]|nr:helix-turn-helix domain-containing protein [Bacteroidota bacterium]